MRAKYTLKLDWCGFQAANYACKHWHYSKSMPTSPRVSIGVWEDAKFIGVVIFSRGANKSLHRPFGVDSTQVCELTRIALCRHATPVTRIVRIALQMLLKHAPALKLVVSYADPNEGHLGKIYQAGNWIYCGQTATKTQGVDYHGRRWHQRSMSKTGVVSFYGQMRVGVRREDVEMVKMLGKHRYLYVLDRTMLDKFERLRQPFPRLEAQQA